MRQLYLLIILAISISGCSFIATSAPQWVDTSTNISWPAPPEKARIRFLREFKGFEDFKKSSNTQKILTWLTGDQENQLPFVTPYGVAADGLGRIWVADMGIHGVHCVDLRRNKIDYIFNAGSTPLSTPAGVALDVKRNRLYVSDTTLAKVFLFNLEGRFITEWNAPDNFERPAGLAVDRAGQLYIVDAKKNLLSIFSPDGIIVRTITSGALPEQTFNTPSNVAVNDQGEIYVVDSLNFRVEVFSPTGESIRTFGSIGDGPGYFARPRGITLDKNGNIYISDASFNNIQVFDKAGKLLIYFGQSGEKAGEFSLPAGIVFDQYNRLYIVDSYNKRLQILEFLP